LVALGRIHYGTARANVPNRPQKELGALPCNPGRQRGILARLAAPIQWKPVLAQKTHTDPAISPPIAAARGLGMDDDPKRLEETVRKIANPAGAE
jgi:hypothetical protein